MEGSAGYLPQDQIMNNQGINFEDNPSTTQRPRKFETRINSPQLTYYRRNDTDALHKATHPVLMLVSDKDIQHLHDLDFLEQLHPSLTCNNHREVCSS
ncbi:hypothetical protein CRG98_030767 [Punica granatum]|uniref:Uncharacterized protein n=1 Tax=Punica granatum TaxID=22663 RepID=A0A2I0IXT8_PUNGR|nr:hypothetical protein CRG98_030767 [Punica granatum]